MRRYPLLAFPDKAVTNRSKKSGFRNSFRTPTPEVQGRRLNRKFTELHKTLLSKKIEIQDSPEGLEPEQVLIFETIGSVEDFSRAVSKIDGFEWLAEFATDNIEPDDYFYKIKDEEKVDGTLGGRLYFIFTNLAAMKQLLSYWNLWKKEPNFYCKSGEHRGKGKLKEVFEQLRDIRQWSVEDRFSESDTLERWREDIAIEPTRMIKFEIELWYRTNRRQRTQSYLSVRKSIQELGGRVIKRADIQEIRYHAILAELPGEQIKGLINNQNVDLVKSDYIMFFRPSGQIIIDSTYTKEDLQVHDSQIDELYPSGDPIIAIYDGYPMSRHEALRDRLIIDDPDNMEDFYQVDDRKHGTYMSSLIIQGDIENNDLPLSTPVYLRPIMRPDIFDRREFVPDDDLLVDIIHRATKRMLEGESEFDASAPSVKIINLSIGDPARLYYNSISPLAKLLDWLSFKYKVLFIISTGNHASEIKIDLSEKEFNELSTEEKQKMFFDHFLKNSRYSRIMSPSESINNLTVGALHHDNSQILSEDRRFNPYEDVLPGTYTAIGRGHQRSVKPDLVYPGGRLMYDYHRIYDSIIEPTSYKRQPGIKVAAPDSSLNKYIYETGTSVATALMTRSAHKCYEFIEQFEVDNQILIPDQYKAIIIKAMLTHGSSWDGLGYDIDKLLDAELDKTQRKNIKSKIIGYGYPDIDRVKECTEQRVTIIGHGELEEGKAHVYSLPLPPSLASKTLKRKLTISLAWMTPISPATQKYRTAQLWFDAKNDLANTRQYIDFREVKRGTLQHEVFEGNRATAFIDGDSIKIKINCSKDANDFSEKIPYAIIVTLEVAEGLELPIYQEVKERILQPIRIDQPMLF